MIYETIRTDGVWQLQECWTTAGGQKRRFIGYIVTGPFPRPASHMKIQNPLLAEKLYLLKATS